MTSNSNSSALSVVCEVSGVVGRHTITHKVTALSKRKVPVRRVSPKGRSRKGAIRPNACTKPGDGRVGTASYKGQAAMEMRR